MKKVISIVKAILGMAFILAVVFSILWIMIMFLNALGDMIKDR